MIKALLSVSVMSVTAAILLTGCGGGDDAATTPTASTGYYVDAAVSGVSYVCGDQNGTTGTDGSFKFQKDQGCTFSLAGITLRTIAAANLVDKITILEDNVSVAQMLQTLDSDGNASNGITITPAVIAAVRTAGITSLSDAHSEIYLYEAVKNVAGYTGSAKSITDTEAHLIESQTPILKALIAGKTFYRAEYDPYTISKSLASINFNTDVTKLNFTLLKTTDGVSSTGTTEAVTVELNGTKIMFHDSSEPEHLYEQYMGQTADYIILESNEGNDPVRLYFDKTKAEAYYATLNSTSTTTPTTSTFVASTLLAGNTFYDVGKDLQGKWQDTIVINAQGNSMTMGTELPVAITLSSNRISVPSRNEYGDIEAVNSDYILLRLENNTTARWYFDQTKAQTYYSTL
jgi:hypothetical protein